MNSLQMVCDMALHWLAHNATKEDDVNSIFRSLRLERVSSSYLENYIEEYPPLRRFPVCQVSKLRHIEFNPFYSLTLKSAYSVFIPMLVMC